MARYVIAESANADIDDILCVIVRDNEPAAWRWYTELHAKFGLLAESPHIGRVRDDLLPDAHMFPFGNYLIFYDIAPHLIHILHVVHGARDVANVFSVERGRP